MLTTINPAQHRRIALLLGAVGVASLLAVALPELTAAGEAVSAAAASPATVKIDNFAFDAQTVTVAAGSTVTWVNDDDAPHTVVADDGKSFRSKVLDTGETFSFTFPAAGTWGYFCSVHPHMTGKVVVKPAQAG